MYACAHTHAHTHILRARMQSSSDLACSELARSTSGGASPLPKLDPRPASELQAKLIRPQFSALHSTQCMPVSRVIPVPDKSSSAHQVTHSRRLRRSAAAPSPCPTTRRSSQHPPNTLSEYDLHRRATLSCPRPQRMPRASTTSAPGSTAVRLDYECVWRKQAAAPGRKLSRRARASARGSEGAPASRCV